jgi:hypothetical protein
MDKAPYILSNGFWSTYSEKIKPMEADLSTEHHLLTGNLLEISSHIAGESNAGNTPGEGDFLCIFSSLRRL